MVKLIPEGEKFNTITHFFGVIASLAGLLLLLSSSNENSLKTIGVSIYGSTLVFLFSSSTIYHSVKGKFKKFFHKIDHIAIYLLIAGTYTPIALVTLQGYWGGMILTSIWGLAAIGITLDIFSNAHGRRIAQLFIYIVMGWLIVIAYQPMISLFPLNGLKLLLAGGIIYSAGIFFFLYDRKIRHFHGIWHLFVLGGSISHFLAIYLFL